MRGSVVAAGYDPPPVLKPSEHDFDAVAAFVFLPVVFDRSLARSSSWNAGFYAAFLFQGIPKPAGVITPVSQHPLCIRKAAQQGSGTCSGDPDPFFSPSLEAIWHSRCSYIFQPIGGVVR